MTSKADTPPEETLTRGQLGLEEAEALSAEIRVQLRGLVQRARSAASRSYGGGGFKARRSERILLKILIVLFFVEWVMPVFGSAVYYGLIASDQYVTESSFSIDGGGSRLSSSLGGIIGKSGESYSSYAVEYLESSNVIEDMKSDFDFETIFGRNKADIVSAIAPNATLEERTDYWNEQIRLQTDGLTGQVNLQVRAFTPEDSLKIHNVVLAKTEARVNEVSERMRRIQLQEAELSVFNARKNLELALRDLAAARKKHGVLDVDLTIRGYEELVQKLREERSALEQRIAVSTRTTPNAPELQVLRSQIRIVDDQITAINSKIASQDPSDGTSLAAIANDIGLRQTDVTVARTELVSRLADLEAASAAATDQDLFLAVNVRPSLPQEATYPKRFSRWLVISIAATIIYGIIGGLAYLVRDNMA